MITTSLFKIQNNFLGLWCTKIELNVSFPFICDRVRDFLMFSNAQGTMEARPQIYTCRLFVRFRKKDTPLLQK